jgi:hypothetical protein
MPQSDPALWPQQSNCMDQSDSALLRRPLCHLPRAAGRALHRCCMNSCIPQADTCVCLAVRALGLLLRSSHPEPVVVRMPFRAPRANAYAERCRDCAQGGVRPSTDLRAAPARACAAVRRPLSHGSSTPRSRPADANWGGGGAERTYTAQVIRIDCLDGLIHE